ncbi:hypothetical protein [Thermococcus thioreducens]|uniref:Oligosaccharide repeat unit polymerase n=1 Tax=Thermococcus thioreducens TaxID=277988 RepID=A0A0Q2UQ76_9EURY|nr:hypothetical protein [Thermococcus thioreducens]ASJ11934.1 hypothetical protein A3L14_03095 [Thermococcus thioreducens]KQH82840.1 hypothetical protein AMR53_04470 [Thermococcus thioreducens]SEW11312.1 Protein of unknown function DUF70 [Thermococcus thioreducens]
MRGLKIFSLGFFSYLTLSLYANYFDEGLRNTIYSRGLEPSVLLLGTVYALAFFAVFSLGYVLNLRLPSSLLAVLFLLLSFQNFPVFSLLAVLVLIVYRLGINPFRLFPQSALLVALLIPSALYIVVGVPLLENSLRYELVGSLVLAAVLAVVGMAYSTLSLRWKTFLVGVYTVLFFLGTFRSLVLLVYLAYFLGTYFDYPQFRKWLLGLSLIPALIIVGMSGGIEAVLVRIGFTFLVFHNLVRLSLPWGFFHGALLFSSNPRGMVASLFGASTNYTYFFFGQPVADFGILGVIEAFLLGTFLGNSEGNRGSFVVVLSLMIYSLDPGVDAFIMLFIVATLLFSVSEGNIT